MPFLAFGFVTFPTPQPAAFNADFARARVLPASFGTRQLDDGGGGGAHIQVGGGTFKRVYEIDAEQGELLSAGSVAVAEKVAVTPSPTSTAIPGELSSLALPVVIGVPVQSGPA